MEAIKFNKLGRMQYSPTFHPNNGKPWHVTEERYVIDYYYSLGPEEISLSLGRTLDSVMGKVRELRKCGRMGKRPAGCKKHKRLKWRTEGSADAKS